MQIVIPPDITLPDKQTVSFKQFLVNSILTDKQFGRNLQTLQAAHRIHQATSTSKEFIELSEADHELLVAVIRQPTNGYNPTTAIHLMPFFNAVIDVKGDGVKSQV
jgi:hypothetical protein